MLRHPLGNRLGDARRLALDAFAARYAAAHGLAFEPTREMPGGALFLAEVEADRSHAFLRGEIDGAGEGMVFYAETIADVRKRIFQGWTLGRFAVPEVAGLARGLACGPRLSPAWGGRVVLASTLPDQLIRVRLGDATFDERHEIGVETRDDELAVREILTSDFAAWLDGLPFGRHGERMLRFELRADVLCVWLRGKLGSSDELDGFLAQAARVTTHVRGLSSAGA